MPKIFKGTIVKKTGEKTVKVAVKRTVVAPVYKKRYTVTKRYLAHDESDKHKLGETVSLIETRPISKRKHYRVI